MRSIEPSSFDSHFPVRQEAGVDHVQYCVGSLPLSVSPALQCSRRESNSCLTLTKGVLDLRATGAGQYDCSTVALRPFFLMRSRAFLAEGLSENSKRRISSVASTLGLPTMPQRVESASLPSFDTTRLNESFTSVLRLRVSGPSGNRTHQSDLARISPAPAVSPSVFCVYVLRGNSSRQLHTLQSLRESSSRSNHLL